MDPQLWGALVLLANGVTAYLVVLTKEATTKNGKNIKKVNAQIQEVQDKQLFVCSRCGAAESPSGLLRVEPDD